jgi:hypothetical protein
MSKNILLKKHNGTDWDVLHPITKAKNVMSSDGGTVQDHIGAGGAAHASATSSEAGFMSPEDKAALDAATSAATASTLAKRDTAGRLKAAAPAAADDVARKNETDAAVTAAATAHSRADAAYSRADAAFTQASDGKTVVAAAITGKGIPASNSDTFPQLATKISSIPLAAGNAVAADVLVGKTFSTPAGTGIPGAMPDNGAVVLTPSALANVAVPNGRHNGSVVAQVAVNTAALLTGHSVAGANGTMPNHGAPTWTPTTYNQVLPAGHFDGGTVLGDTNLKAENIAEGVPLFGVVGNLIGRKSASGTTPVSTSTTGGSWGAGTNSAPFDFIPTIVLARLRFASGGSIKIVTVRQDGYMNVWYDTVANLGSATSAMVNYTSAVGGGYWMTFSFSGVGNSVQYYCEWEAFN